MLAVGKEAVAIVVGQEEGLELLGSWKEEGQWPWGWPDSGHAAID